MAHFEGKSASGRINNSAGRLAGPPLIKPWVMIASVRRSLLTAQILSNHKLVLALLSGGTLLLAGSFTAILAANVFLSHYGYVAPRLYIACVLFVYTIIVAVLVKRDHTIAATIMLLAFYTALGAVTLLIWGINVPAGVLVLGFVIFLAGVLLGTRYIFPTAVTIIGALVVIQLAHARGFVEPDTSSLADPSSFSDVIAYATLFVLFAIISWLSGRRTEQSLDKARAAEADLQSEKDSLELRLEERTASLREAQLEEMRQLYHFAELGQLSTVVLHDLANNLTALTLDIDDIATQTRSTDALARARESIAYLDDMVMLARKQLRFNDDAEVFDAIAIAREAVNALNTKASRKGVAITQMVEGADLFEVSGDPLRFSQIITILVTNAIDAYSGIKRKNKSIHVLVRREGPRLRIIVSDQAKGIDDARRGAIFEPFHSTKPNGMGIGLFIAKEIVERHFKGSLTLADPKAGAIGTTEFVAVIPGYKNDGPA